MRLGKGDGETVPCLLQKKKNELSWKDNSMDIHIKGQVKAYSGKPWQLEFDAWNPHSKNGVNPCKLSSDIQ